MITTTIDEAFAQFRRYAWRLEVLDTYLVEGEQDRLDAFRRGEPMPPPATDDWQQLIRAAIDRGAHMSRVRLVGHPVTDYTRWEFAAYPENIRYGEDVQVVDRSWLDASWNTAADVWLFDDELAFQHCYDPDGRWLRCEPIEDVPAMVEMRRRISQFAVPLAAYGLTDLHATPAGPLSLPARTGEK